MAKAEIKTKKTEASAEDFLNAINDEQVRADSFELLALFKKGTKADPKMWGAAIVGFGSVVLKYASGRELDWFLCGFAPRKQNFSLYLSIGFPLRKELLQKLGKHSMGKGCLYLKSLQGIDKKILLQLIKESAKEMKKRDLKK